MGTKSPIQLLSLGFSEVSAVISLGIFAFICTATINFAPLSLAAGESQNVIGCEIIGMEKQVLRKYPGEICHFDNDGFVLSGQDTKIVLYDTAGDVRWSKPLKSHHQINHTLDNRNFLVIASRTVEDGARTDILYVVNRDGEFVKSFDLYENRALFVSKYWKDAVDRRFPLIWTPKRFPDVKWELTHVNSFYEIPEVPAALTKKLPAFQRGNFIVNDISLMLTFVLSQDLKIIMWQQHLTTETGTMLHDVQVLTNGHLLYYDNGTPKKPQSALVEFDLETAKTAWEYYPHDRKKFYSARWGGVQLLANGNVLFSDIRNGRRSSEIDRKGREVWSMESPPKIYLQQVKRQDFTEFLAGNKGL